MNNLFIFGSGIVVGAVIALFSVRKYAKQKINEAEEKAHKEAEEDILKTTTEQKERLQKEFEEALKEYRNEDEPYRITSDEFDSSTFDTESITMYKNGVFVWNVNDEQIKNVDDIIGNKNIPKSSEGLEAFYIRNPEKQMDYEINIMLCEWPGG